MTSGDLLVAIGPWLWLGFMVLFALVVMLVDWISHKERPQLPPDRLNLMLYIFAFEVPLFVLLEVAGKIAWGNRSVLPMQLPGPLIVAVNVALVLGAIIALWVAYARDGRRREQQHRQS